MRLGLWLSKGRFVWRVGAWWWWLPFQGIVCKVWNHCACARWGHDDSLFHLARAGHIPESEAKCVNCAAPIKDCVGGHMKPTLEKAMERFCRHCRWCNLKDGIGSNHDGSLRYPGCIQVGADCGYYRTCEGPDGCLAEFNRLYDGGCPNDVEEIDG